MVLIVFLTFQPFNISEREAQMNHWSVLLGLVLLAFGGILVWSAWNRPNDPTYQDMAYVVGAMCILFGGLYLRHQYKQFRSEVRS